MKLFVGLAFAAVMANAGLINQAQQQFKDNSGISAANQNKLQRLFNRFGMMAQREAKQLGINFNFKNVIRNLGNNQHVKKAENSVENAVNQALNSNQG